MNKKGFTLIELLVVIVIIGILVAIALPNFIKIKDKAREAEVKQNLHSIQLAVERYGVDEEGNYPYFLFGGDTRFNIGTHCTVVGLQMMNWTNWTHEFDMFNLDLPDDKWCYGRVGGLDDLLSDDLQAGFGDTMSYEGYMPKYPGNPFVTGKGAQQYSWEFLQYGPPASIGAGLGGYDGTCMWNLGFWGDLPQLHKFTPAVGNTQVLLDLPGQFYYHPRWQDSVTNVGHLLKQADATGFGHRYWSTVPPAVGPPFDSDDISSLDVAAYDLLAVGSPRTKGQDLDNSAEMSDDRPNQFRTGYLTQGQERNPWIAQGEPPYNAAGNFEERPYSDSIPDFIIIHLSSGIDKKMQSTMDK